MMTENNNYTKRRTRIIIAAFCLIAASAIIYFCWPAPQPAVLPAIPAPDPIDAEKVLMQAKDFSGTGNIDKAISLLQQYSFDHPGEITVLPTLAKLYILTDQKPKAAELVETLMKAEPQNPKILWLRGELEKASGKDPMPWFQKSAELPAADTDILTQYALVLWDAKQYKPAEKYIERAIAGGSKDAQIHAIAGHLALKQGQLDKAKKYLTYATQKDKQSVAAWADLAETCKKLGQTKEAIEAIKHVLTYASGDMRKNMLFELAGMLVEQKLYMQAGDTYVKAADAQPTLKMNCSFEAAKCYWQVGKYALAMKYIDIAHEIQPENKDVNEWRTKIEDSRFGRVNSETPKTQPAK